MKDYITLSSGKQVSAYNGVIGIKADSSDINLFSGFDEQIDTISDTESLTKQECLEIADLMLAAWTNYKDIIKAMP